MHSYWIDDIAARIRQAQQAGLAQGPDPELAGEALGWMAERSVTSPSIETPVRSWIPVIAVIARNWVDSPSARTAHYFRSRDSKGMAVRLAEQAHNAREASVSRSEPALSDASEGRSGA